jgi:lipopolysaccharide export system permease protein
MLLLKKYIIRETLLYFLAIIALLFFISIANTFISLLTKVAIGKLPFSMACQAILLYIPESLGLLIPVSLFMAILFVISKLYADNEIVALFISGVNLKFLIKIIMLIAIIMATITAFLTLYLIPTTAKIKEEILAKGEKLGIISSIIPGYFQLVNDGKQIFYVGDVVNKNKIQDVFIASGSLVVTAKTGEIQTIKDQEGSFLVLQDGYRYSGLDSNNFSVINFMEYGRKLLPKNQELSNNKHKFQKTIDIWNSKNQAENAEWQWRLAMPISVLILAVLAIALAKVSPRQGRFAKFLPAILFYIIYCNAMIFTRRLLAEEDISSIYGIWSAHILFGVLAIILLLKSSGWLLYIYKKL